MNLRALGHTLSTLVLPYSFGDVRDGDGKVSIQVVILRHVSVSIDMNVRNALPFNMTNKI